MNMFKQATVLKYGLPVAFKVDDDLKVEVENGVVGIPCTIEGLFLNKPYMSHFDYRQHHM